MEGTTALILGILSVTLGLYLCPFVFAVPALVFGNLGKKLASQGLATNGGKAKAGIIMGGISLAMNTIGLILFVYLNLRAGQPPF